MKFTKKEISPCKQAWVDISIDVQSRPDYLIVSPEFKKLVGSWYKESSEADKEEK